MKRLFKKKRQKGFTLLETLLSVAIMVIISTMLLNGFAATMGYSYHTSVYSKAAAVNYSKSMSTLADLHGKTTAYDDDGNMTMNNYAVVGAVGLGSYTYMPTGFVTGAPQTSVVTIKFETAAGITTNAASATVLNNLNAVEFAYKDVPSDVNIGGTIDNTSVAANRRTFFYVPTYNYDPTKVAGATDLMNDAYLGHVGIYLLNTNKYGTGTAGKYCWGYLTDQGDASTFVLIGTPFSM